MKKPIYITIKEIGRTEVVYKTKQLSDYINIDYNTKGDVLGIEILDYLKLELNGKEIK